MKVQYHFKKLQTRHKIWRDKSKTWLVEFQFYEKSQ